MHVLLFQVKQQHGASGQLVPKSKASFTGGEAANDRCRSGVIQLQRQAVASRNGFVQFMKTGRFVEENGRVPPEDRKRRK
jgi:hypothetical protein